MAALKLGTKQRIVHLLPVRNHKVNNGLPHHLRLKDIPVLTVVKVAWTDTPPSNELVLEVEPPLGLNGRPVKRGCIYYKSIDGNGRLHSFQSTQVLHVFRTRTDSVHDLFTPTDDAAPL